MLFSPVYTEAQPLRNAAFASRKNLRGAVHAVSRTSSVCFKSFCSYPFRTLASHLKATVSSNSLEIKRFRTLCKIPGIGYPPLAQALELRFFLRRDGAGGANRYPNHPSPTPFRINTCKSVTKQRTLTIFGMNTYKKHRGRGV